MGLLIQAESCCLFLYLAPILLLALFGTWTYFRRMGHARLGGMFRWVFYFTLLLSVIAACGYLDRRMLSVVSLWTQLAA
jgi:hypothetical protein